MPRNCQTTVQPTGFTGLHRFYLRTYIFYIIPTFLSAAMTDLLRQIQALYPDPLHQGFSAEVPAQQPHAFQGWSKSFVDNLNCQILSFISFISLTGSSHIFLILPFLNNTTAGTDVICISPRNSYISSPLGPSRSLSV